ncbi:copper resistance CopC family protein [Saccharothrix sp. NRRL B-16314]|uniref:copper resistance CopC family protein n=1 Tax=Saccharothrix sp. NRRL B-16314 TaxID=1463825 RepID=UPI00068A9C75|nr:copper resistance CopC family protein [Saccharothrix sp. NRRL B-16314]
MTRLALSALLAILALFGAAPQALAHTELVSSDPAEGASLPQRPTRLTLTFTEPVPAESATVTVTGPDGAAWPLGEIVADGPTLTIALGEGGSQAGRYAVTWMVEALDGDFTDGTFAFTLAVPPAGTAQPTAPAVTSPAVTSQAGTPTPGTPTSAADSGSVSTPTAVATGTSTPAAAGADEGGGPPLWVWIVLAAVLSMIGIAVAVALGRRAGGDAEDQSNAE